MEWAHPSRSRDANKLSSRFYNLNREDAQRLKMPLVAAPMAALGSPSILLTDSDGLLVGIMSARRVSELAALSISRELCMFQEDSVVVHTDSFFLPKVKSTFHRSQEIVLPSLCPNLLHPREREWHTLDIWRALSFYLD